MSGLEGEIARLLSLPGERGAGPSSIVRRAAAAHRELLAAVHAVPGLRCCPTVATIADLLPRDPRTRQRFLCHPVLVEGLHDLAPISPLVEEWRACIADLPARRGDAGRGDRGEITAGRLLGNAALPLLLRADRRWRGTLRLGADCFGQVRFPLSDWSLSLTSTGGGIVSEEPLWLRLDESHAVWSRDAEAARPFLAMSRDMLVCMIARNSPTPAPGRMLALDPQWRPEWRRAAPLCRGGARFLPIHGSDERSHAAVCGGIVKMLHGEMVRWSPVVHDEFCRLVESVQGFELGGTESDVVQSFSEPTRPGVMGFNVPFTPEDEPRLFPFCLTCLGHEMAHTKLYLIGSLGWGEGWSFLRNGSERTNVIPRYGRALSVRTLFHVPYTHLYEWTLLMDALEATPRDGDWTSEDAVRFGNDLRDEIQEAFALLEAIADLTPAGRLALSRVRSLFCRTNARWRQWSPQGASPRTARQ